MRRIVRYNHLTDSIEVLKGIVAAPKYVLGGKNTLCVYDGSYLSVFDYTTNSLAEGSFTEQVTDCKSYIVSISGNTIKVYRKDLTLYKSYTMNYTLRWVAIQEQPSVIRLLSVRDGYVDVIDLATDQITSIDLPVSGALTYPYNFIHCSDGGFCIASGNTTTWVNPSGYKGYAHALIKPDLTKCVSERGHVSLAFASWITVSPDGYYLENWEQNGAATSMLLHNPNCAGVYEVPVSASYNNPCITAAGKNTFIGNHDVAKIVIRKTDGTYASASLSSSLWSGYCNDYDSFSICIVVTKDRAIRRIKIDRTTATINEQVLYTLSTLPSIFIPIPV